MLAALHIYIWGTSTTPFGLCKNSTPASLICFFLKHIFLLHIFLHIRSQVCSVLYDKGLFTDIILSLHILTMSGQAFYDNDPSVFWREALLLVCTMFPCDYKLKRNRAEMSSWFLILCSLLHSGASSWEVFPVWAVSIFKKKSNKHDVDFH